MAMHQSRLMCGYFKKYLVPSAFSYWGTYELIPAKQVLPGEKNPCDQVIQLNNPPGTNASQTFRKPGVR